MTDQRFASCRGCGREFAKDGFGRQSSECPRLCVDCYHRERAFHPHHTPGVTCLDAIIQKGDT